MITAILFFRRFLSGKVRECWPVTSTTFSGWAHFLIRQFNFNSRSFSNNVSECDCKQWRYSKSNPIFQLEIFIYKCFLLHQVCFVWNHKLTPTQTWFIFVWKCRLLLALFFNCDLNSCESYTWGPASQSDKWKHINLLDALHQFKSSQRPQILGKLFSRER